MRAGIFGGTFNPFHNGHITIIRHVRQKYLLDRIFLIPCGYPPHKPGIEIAPAHDRFAMVEKAVAGLEGFLVSDIELKRKGPSFTIDTICESKKRYPEYEFHLIMGSDAFLDIATWKQGNRIFEQVKVIIMLRGQWKNYRPIISFIDENISKDYMFDESKLVFSHEKKQDIMICKVPRIDISSTMIRQNLKHNKSITGLVPAEVEEIIKTKELYI